MNHKPPKCPNKMIFFEIFNLILEFQIMLFMKRNSLKLNMALLSWDVIFPNLQATKCSNELIFLKTSKLSLKIEPFNTFPVPHLLLYELNLAWVSWNVILTFKMLGKPPNTLMNLSFFKSQIY